MLARYNIHEAKTQLSKLLERVEKGEEIVIARAGKPIARLVPEADRRKGRRPPPGSTRPKIEIGDDFDDPLPDWLLDLFEGKGEEAKDDPLNWPPDRTE
ncbi:MAG: type II toxin-antitoxin system Phd/YefM family antitoxin [Geminicoccaceae bacterium]|nr:type II toxin-antitoxin system Phd/YefM family antitoxin [Geminicoccaceae bacterium]